MLVDGVKIIEPDGWALVLPDPEEALTHVWAEAGSDVEARRLAQEYVRAHPPGAALSPDPNISSSRTPVTVNSEMFGGVR